MYGSMLQHELRMMPFRGQNALLSCRAMMRTSNARGCFCASYRRVLRTACGAPEAQPAAHACFFQVGPAKDIALDEKLRALDALFERQFAEKGSKREQGLEVATFRRK